MKNKQAEKTPGSYNRSLADDLLTRRGATLPAIPALQTKKPLQKITDEEEEPLQGKFTLQLKGSAIAGSDSLLEEEDEIGGKAAQLKKEDEDELPIQGKFSVQKKENKTGLPDNLKAGVEDLSGMAMDDVNVHYNSDKPAGLHALAYAQGTDIHVGPGQEQHLPHEAWHIVQQKQGRVKRTIQMKEGVPVNDDKGLENEADIMGLKALQAGSNQVNNKSTGIFQYRKQRPESRFVIQRFTESEVRERATKVHDWVTAKIDVRAWEIGIELNRSDGAANWAQAKSEVEEAWKYYQKIESGDLLTPDEWALMKKGLTNEEYEVAVSKVSPEYANITQYNQVNLVDLGGPGTGHQAAVLKLIESIAKTGYKGTVNLSYNAKKTRIYANRLGKKDALDHPQQSYDLYHKNWEGTFPAKSPLKINCRPHGEIGVVMKEAEKKVFTDLETYWKVAWPGGAVPDFNDPAPVQKFGALKAQWDLRKTWSSGNLKVPELQKAFRDTINKFEIGATEVEVDSLKNLDNIKPGKKTLTGFGAMDMHFATEIEASAPDAKETYFEKHWLTKLKEMTGEDDPVTIILQPFLWAQGHKMQVRGGKKPTVDIAEKISKAGGKASYGWKPPEPLGDTAVIDSQPPIPKAILTGAKGKAIHLVSAYYGGSVAGIGYTDLLKVLTKVFKLVADVKPVVIALLGDEDMEAHKTAETDLNDVDVKAKLDAVPSTVKIQLAHIGRTTAMAQFQRYSELFVTEGANTWQELLTLGTPTLSAAPEGSTQPWLQGPSGGDSDTAKDMVKSVSEALIAAKSEKGDVNVKKIAAFIEDLRKPDSLVTKYYDDWSGLMKKAESDQVIMALRSLPDTL